jgi:GNAT superfamily N-acetyltransferase
MATAEELRRLREEQSIFSALYDMARQQRSELAAEGRRPVLGGLLSKEPTYGTDTLRYEGIGDMLVGLLTPAAKAVDAPISAMRGTIPQEDMINEALGVGGLAMAGGGAVGVPRGAVGANAVRNIKDKYPDVEIDIYGDADRGYELGRIQVPKDQQSSGVGSQVMNDLIAAADAEGAKISLTPDTSFGGTSVSRLKDFYKRFGFVENKGRNKDFSTRNTMYRDPTAMANASKSAGLLTTNAADLRRQANIDRFGYDPNETPEVSGFDAYLRRVNPSDKRIPEENRPDLMMGDMYGMLPRDAEYVSNIGSADIYRTPDGSYYATAYNPDLGEMDVVGYAIKGDKETDLQVVSEMQGKGIGGELQYLFRKENPDAPTGGLTEAGEASLLKTYNKLRDDGVVAANASKSAGLLTTAASEAQDMAKRILELRAEGRASEVTDEMMAQADPQYMFANTPLPMDEASRIARAEAAGFDVGNPVFHGGASGIKAMDADVSEGKDFDTGVWTTSDRYNANRYAGSRTEGAPKINDQQNWSIYDDRGSVYPLLAKTSGYGETNFRGRNWGDAPEGAIIRGGGQPSQRISEVREDWRAWPYTSEAVRAARDTGRSGLVIKDVVDIGPNFPHKDHIGLGSEISDDVVAIDPSTLRSRFARFDPEFAHLSNLSAANVSPIGGLLAQSGVSDKQAERIEEYLRRRGLLD